MVNRRLRCYRLIDKFAVISETDWSLEYITIQTDELLQNLSTEMSFIFTKMKMLGEHFSTSVKGFAWRLVLTRTKSNLEIANSISSPLPQGSHEIA